MIPVTIEFVDPRNIPAGHKRGFAYNHRMAAAVPRKGDWINIDADDILTEGVFTCSCGEVESVWFNADENGLYYPTVFVEMMWEAAEPETTEQTT